jgi:hypothetical protein
MPNTSGGWIGGLLVLASALVSGCASSSDSTAPGASGTRAATAGAGELGGTGGSGAAASGTSGIPTSGNGGAAGELTAEQGGTSNAGPQPEDGGVRDTTQNIFVSQISIGQGGGAPLCLPRALPYGEPPDDSEVNCFIAEFKPDSCDCTRAGRTVIEVRDLIASKRQLESSGACGGSTGVDCDSFCACDISQTVGSDLDSCLNDVVPAQAANGFCVIDLMRSDQSGAPDPLGSPELVAECPMNQKRRLRFVGAGAPAGNAKLFLGCWQ